MKRKYMLLSLLFLFAGCSFTQGEKASIVLKLNESQKNISLKEDDAQKVFQIIDAATYDEDQHHPKKNPKGYRATTLEPVYELFIEYNNEEIHVILWESGDQIKVKKKDDDQLYWYQLQSSEELYSIINTYTK
ncbi:hypothetical protein M2475_000778 [Breznakia sp. PF5-3]|uniref:hypothetical protein n=1 Tax=unclassified Breznakia TaxID=2623764 RepID=UPI0024071A9D|nr:MULTISPECIES: hypothetical protein [unclassified Breznakia]MDF9824821.1 hypothetical protein [Breznakia sp. PM6-1]MDF9835217.1 hypothetical protein [Breznakia sp. PF5-3]MDF9837329.1 hypothetical protein [Breznakia sp. PFB2-8]MDF9859747.1 hypothetical protein [Breznakia sp. PH5-24]